MFVGVFEIIIIMPAQLSIRLKNILIHIIQVGPILSSRRRIASHYGAALGFAKSSLRFGFRILMRVTSCDYSNAWYFLSLFYHAVWKSSCIIYHWSLILPCHIRHPPKFSVKMEIWCSFCTFVHFKLLPCFWNSQFLTSILRCTHQEYIHMLLFRASQSQGVKKIMKNKCSVQRSRSTVSHFLVLQQLFGR